MHALLLAQVVLVVAMHDYSLMIGIHMDDV